MQHSKMTFDIETYLNSLSDGILTLDISNKGIHSLPDLTRFTNLEILYCHDNHLISLPDLPEKLTLLSCYKNKLTFLPPLPENLEKLFCNNNQLTSLPYLPKNLKSIYCDNNQLTSFPHLPKKLTSFYYSNNPIYNIVYSESFIQTKQNIQIVNNFRYLYYCLKFKIQFRKWLWERVREPNAKKQYHPTYLIDLIKNLSDNDDNDNDYNDNNDALNKVLDN